MRQQIAGRRLVDLAGPLTAYAEGATASVATTSLAPQADRTAFFVYRCDGVSTPSGTICRLGSTNVGRNRLRIVPPNTGGTTSLSVISGASGGDINTQSANVDSQGLTAGVHVVSISWAGATNAVQATANGVLKASLNMYVPNDGFLDSGIYLYQVGTAFQGVALALVPWVDATRAFAVSRWLMNRYSVGGGGA